VSPACAEAISATLVLAGARFEGAQLSTADFRGANLEGARDLTAAQLGQALTDRGTTLPNGSHGLIFDFRSGEAALTTSVA